ncbi:MAG: OmpA family protein [Saprospiraceae bacterium]|nr:OmpA family protein [Saprospiraceae bacterium]
MAGLALMSMIACKNQTSVTSVDQNSGYHTDASVDGNVAKSLFANADPSNLTLLNSAALENGNIAYQIIEYQKAGFPDNQKLQFRNAVFPTGSADISEALKKEVEELSIVLKAYPDVRIKLESHTDNTGDEALNQMLSDLRVSSIKELLTKQYGVAEDRIEVVGHGQSKPLTDNDSEESRAKNSRILLYFTK